MLKEKYVNTINETSINVVNTGIDSIRNKNITKTGIRVYSDGLVGIAGSIGKYDESQLTQKAISALNYNVAYPYALSTNRTEDLTVPNKLMDNSSFVSEMEELLEDLRSRQSNFIFSGKINMTEQESALLNDSNLDLHYKDKSLQLGLMFKEKTSTNIMDGGVGFDERSYNKSDVLHMMNSICDAYVNKVDLPKEGKLPVVFLQPDYLSLRKFLMDLNGQLFGTGASLFSGKLGQKIFNENFTLYQTNNPEDVQLTPYFDAEGTINKDFRYALVENGVLMSPFTDKKTADMFKLPHTGAAACEYDGVPDIRFVNMRIKESEKTVKDLLGGQLGIAVMIASGGDFTPTGDFGSPVQLAMLVEGDKILGRLPELRVSSNIFKMYGEDFKGVSSDNIFPSINSKVVVMDLQVNKL